MMQYKTMLGIIYTGSSNGRYLCCDPSEPARSVEYECISYHYKWAGSLLHPIIYMKEHDDCDAWSVRFIREVRVSGLGIVAAATRRAFHLVR